MPHIYAYFQDVPKAITSEGQQNGEYEIYETHRSNLYIYDLCALFVFDFPVPRCRDQYNQVHPLRMCRGPTLCLCGRLAVLC